MPDDMKFKLKLLFLHRILLCLRLDWHLLNCLILDLGQEMILSQVRRAGLHGAPRQLLQRRAVVARHQVQRPKAHRLRGLSFYRFAQARPHSLVLWPVHLQSCANLQSWSFFICRTCLWATSTSCVSRTPGSTSPRPSSSWSHSSQSSTSRNQAIVFYGH